jgi:multiple sugar transport system substrate-binding protein
MRERQWRGGGSGSEKKITGAKVIDPASMDKPDKGTIHYCTGKDTPAPRTDERGLQQEVREPGLQGRTHRVPGFADQQRAQFIQRQQAKSDDCDVFNSDVIWTAEFASQKWLYDLTPYVEKSKDTYIAAPLETVHYGGKYWGAPASSDAAFLFYRTDKGSGKPRPPGRRSTPRPRRPAASSTRGAPYEGLTCDYLELAFAAGGKVPVGRRQEVRDQLRPRTSRRSS